MSIGMRKKAVILFLLFVIAVSNLAKEEIEAFLDGCLPTSLIRILMRFFFSRPKLGLINHI